MAKRIVVITLCITASFLIFNYQPLDKVATAKPKEVSLSSTIFFGVPSVKEIKQNINLQEVNKCLHKYLKAIPQKSYLLSAEIPADRKKSVYDKRRNLEEQIVIILGEKTRDEAKAFAKAVPLYAEWEGMSEAPLEEANFVDNWLSKRTDTTIAPFLHLFKAHRLRAGYECAQAGNEKGLWPILAERYKESLDKAITSANSLVSCIATDMEEQKYVYLQGYGRP
jgi:hypothetical protein